ncbi:hypothetical protein PoB_000962000 [Plakobranchus ocellatus]|uniref:Uncharacterized protein n=1 Tax=Plakobranchus ocellatus TaxID=259542 RepID=A0AAV3YK56_9GAST|nr:hypothetical protein PoB_000962000 [Plakobranchus ocellatus]
MLKCIHTSLRSKTQEERLRRKKMDQGHHECEVLGSGPEAAESASAWNSCSKNPGHHKFIPAAKFCGQHMPEDCQGQLVLNYVRNISRRTVRLRVGYTSARRPRGYSFYTARRSNILHTGSGWLHALAPGVGPCQCSRCAGSFSPSVSQTWYNIYIDTACHVVFNSKEAESTIVDFFYDDETARVDGRMKSVSGLELRHKDVADDWCRMICATHDQSLVDTLKLCLKEEEILFQSLMIYNPSTFWRNLCVIVSHPHGQPKQITVGEAKRDMIGRHKKRFVYSTDTCPGSSGAPVLVLNDPSASAHFFPWPMKDKQMWTSPHSVGEVDGKLNRSGASWIGCDDEEEDEDEVGEEAKRVEEGGFDGNDVALQMTMIVSLKMMMIMTLHMAMMVALKRRRGKKKKNEGNVDAEEGGYLDEGVRTMTFFCLFVFNVS